MQEAYYSQNMSQLCFSLSTCMYMYYSTCITVTYVSLLNNHVWNASTNKNTLDPKLVGWLTFLLPTALCNQPAKQNNTHGLCSTYMCESVFLLALLVFGQAVHKQSMLALLIVGFGIVLLVWLNMWAIQTVSQRLPPNYWWHTEIGKVLWYKRDTKIPSDGVLMMRIVYLVYYNLHITF